MIHVQVAAIQDDVSRNGSTVYCHGASEYYRSGVGVKTTGGGDGQGVGNGQRLAPRVIVPW